ncbi:apoptosis regulator BAX-like isoform X2 [Esox lucius]|uniref:apoptosis regulator BAX-like isoform X2 n=1 Tax=Esox lucius TaxID=8010 RepID=UPI00147688B4|nr:apoptosis regulator BAX-like isoform X2 [Esox lucius]
MAPVRLSEYRVGEAVLNRVMKDQLADVSSPEDLVTYLEKVKNEDEDEDEEKLILQLALIVRRIGEALKNDKEMKTMMGKMSNKSNYWKVVEKVFEDGLITWERIAVLFYVAGRMAVKVVIAHLPQYVKDILTWTLEYFKRNLLSWVKENGGWVRSVLSHSQTPQTVKLAPAL